VTDEFRAVIIIALGFAGVVTIWLSAVWVASGFNLP
jgi:hypothetical protein